MFEWLYSLEAAFSTKLSSVPLDSGYFQCERR